MAKKTVKKTIIRTPIAIIGSGFGGICMGIQLKKAGIHDFMLLERSNDIGGSPGIMKKYSRNWQKQYGIPVARAGI